MCYLFFKIRSYMVSEYFYIYSHTYCFKEEALSTAYHISRKHTSFTYIELIPLKQSSVLRENQETICIYIHT